MATSAFKSTSRRSSIAPGDAGSATRPDAGAAHRRSRSLSRYSSRFPPPPPESDEFFTPRGKFVNKTRGSGFPEISLDDLADEFFGTKGFEAEEEESRSGSVRTGRFGRRGDDERFRMETESSRRRGRSVSKKSSFGNGDGSRQQRRSVSVARRPSDDLEDEKNLFNGELSHHDRTAIEKKGLYGNDRSSRLRRSASVARYRCSDLESDTDKSSGSSKLRSRDNGNFHLSSPKKANNSHALRRSMSQKDILQSLDNCSSHSSSLTDDEIRDICPNKSGPEKTIQAVYTLEKAEHPTGDGDGDESGLYEAMRNEVRHAVREIRTELAKVMVKNEPTALATGDCNQPKGSNSVHVIAEIRRNYTNKLEQSEKRKQDLLAELAAEEQRGQELTNIVSELLPAQKQAAAAERPSRYRRRSNDRTRMSNRLIEEAERYFEDFLSNVEDTDISSFDGEISDTNSTLGGRVKLREPVVPNAMSEVNAILEKATPMHAETDGILLPWLDWETSSDVSPLPCKSNAGVPWTVAKEANVACDSTTKPSSLGSWSPEGNDSSPAVSSQPVVSRFGLGSHLMSSSCLSNAGESSFNMDDYLELQRGEDLLFQLLKQRQRIESGTMILCGRVPY